MTVSVELMYRVYSSKFCKVDCSPNFDENICVSKQETV